jgi:hypothetical protein
MGASAVSAFTPVSPVPRSLQHDGLFISVFIPSRTSACSFSSSAWLWSMEKIGIGKPELKTGLMQL